MTKKASSGRCGKQILPPQSVPPQTCHGTRSQSNRKVLILCTGNSCRSILAEALINHFLRDSWQAFSAGTQPSKVNPRAIAVLQELGIETGYLRSKSVAEFLARDDLDLVITVCDHAKESCPVFLKPVRQVHIGFEDPAPYTDAPDAIALPKFRETRDQIREMLLKSLSV